MRRYKIRLNSLKSSGVLIPILIFLFIQIISLSIFPIVDEILDMLFNPLTYLLFSIGFIIYIIAASSKVLDGLARSYFVAKNSRKVIFDEEIIKVMLAFFAITIVVTVLYIQQFFNKINLNTYSPIYALITALVVILFTLVLSLFVILIFYVAKYKKNEVDEILIVLNLCVDKIIDEYSYFDTDLNLQENEAEFNSLIITFMTNKNEDILMVININNSEY